VLAPVAVAAALAVPPPQIKGAIYQTESEYQYIRVVSDGRDGRELELNEGVATHSAWRPDTVLTGRYWDLFLMLPPLLPRPPERMLVLGNAGGTIGRAYGRFYPWVRIDGVEIDPKLNQVARRYFGADDNPRMRLIAADARPWLELTKQRYDLIVVDAYRQPYVPFYLATAEFFRLAREHLRPGGAIALNVAATPTDHKLSQAIGTTLLTSFPQAWRWQALRFNDVLFALRDPALARGAGAPRRSRAGAGGASRAAFPQPPRAGPRRGGAADRRPSSGRVAHRPDDPSPGRGGRRLRRACFADGTGGREPPLACDGARGCTTGRCWPRSPARLRSPSRDPVPGGSRLPLDRGGLPLPLCTTRALAARALGGRSLRLRPRKQRMLAWVAGLFFAVDLVAWHQGIEEVGAGLATVLGNLQVVLVGLLAWAILRERPSNRSLAAIPVALFGVILISGVLEQGAYGRNPGLGVAFGILTAVSYAGFLLVLREGNRDLRRPAGPLFDATLAAAVGCVLIGLALGNLDWTPGWPAQGYLILLALSSQVVGWLLISITLPRLPAALTSVLLTFQPVCRCCSPGRS
jgi:spermidine synthase/drug/metabolite transporter (DMT)-like permease